MSKISGIKDLDREILSKLDDKELLEACSINKYTWNTVCDDAFLRRRLLLKYPEIESNKEKEESWKRFFQKAIYYIVLLKEKFNYDYTFGNFISQYKLFENYSEEKSDLLEEGSYNGELALVIWCLKDMCLKDTNINSALKCAFKGGHLEIVKYLVENVVDDLNDALIMTSEIGNLEVVKYLVEEKGADFHAFNDTALRIASQIGHLEVVKYLLEKGARIHTNNDHALRLASEGGHLETVKYLIKKGADIHASCDDALKSASRCGHLEVVKILVENGVDIHIEGDCPIRYAIENGHLETVKYLIKKGAYVNKEFLEEAIENEQWIKMNLLN